MREAAHRSRSVRAGVTVLALLACADPAHPDDDAERRAFVAAWCVDCHGGVRPKGRLDLESYAIGDRALTARDLERMLEALDAGEMPPEGEPQPPTDARRRFLAELRERATATAPPPTGRDGDPGRVVMRRLTRAEYANTVRDLVGVDFDAEAFLPADDIGHGFDTVGDTLAMPPLLVEKYFDAAERIAAAAFPERPEHEAPIVSVRGADLDRADGKPRQGSRRADAQGLSTNGVVQTGFEAVLTGQYVLRARVAGQQAGPDPVRIAFTVDRARGGVIDVRNPLDDPAWFEAEVTLAAGAHEVGVAFVNDYYRPEDPDPAQRDRNCAVFALEIVGPLDLPAPPQATPALRDRDPDAWIGRTVRELARRAYRRPVSGADVRALLELSSRGDSPEARVRLALTAMLVHPRFLFRPEPSSGAARDLDAFEVATRLSYFIWSSGPDGALLDAAEHGELAAPAAVATAADRLLDDPRSFALAQNFATQWLQIRDLELRRPDPDRFPDADGALLVSMKAETMLFFDAVLREDRGLRALLDADFTFVDEPLARHYGMAGVRGDFMRRVPATPDRSGLLGQASVLTATSNPTRTSPVQRGKWVLEALLDAPPPPPPPGVVSFERAREEAGGGSVREILARHRADPDCAVCHRRMDELGFALETFDAVGRRRLTDRGLPIDDRGQLPDGTVLEGTQGVRRFLLEGTDFRRALVRHMMVYALGRGLTPADDGEVERVVRALDDEPTLRTLVRTVVQLEAFRRGGAT